LWSCINYIFNFRLLPDSEDLWLAFLQLELEYIRKIIQRRDILGIAPTAPIEIDGEGDGDDSNDANPEKSEIQQPSEIAAEEEAKAKDSEFLAGALPKALFFHALKTELVAGKLDFRLKCLDLINQVGVPVPVFRQAVEGELASSFASDPDAWIIRAQWALSLAERARQLDLKASLDQASDIRLDDSAAKSKKQKISKKRGRDGESEESDAKLSVEAAALRVLEEGIEALAGNSQMWAKAVGFVKDRLTSTGTDTQKKLFLQQRLIDLCQRAREAAQCTDELCVDWISCLLNLDRSLEAVDAAEYSLSQFPMSVGLWFLRIHAFDALSVFNSVPSSNPSAKSTKRTKIDSKASEPNLSNVMDPAGPLTALFRRAFTACESKTDVDSPIHIGKQKLWTEFLTRHIAGVKNASDDLHKALLMQQCEQVFREGMRLFPVFKELYLDWKLSLVSRDTPASTSAVEAALDFVLVSPPVSLLLLLKCIRITKSLKNTSKHVTTINGSAPCKVRALYERALSQFGSQV
jgi:hypothetical protein